MKQEVKTWLTRAEEEFDTAKINLEAEKYFSAAFWCQQAAEKVLKALLIKKTNNFPKIHDLTKLARMSNAPERIIGLCAKINPAYTATRYPDTPGSYSESEGKQVIEYCKEVLGWAKKEINS